MKNHVFTSLLCVIRVTSGALYSQGWHTRHVPRPPSLSLIKCYIYSAQGILSWSLAGATHGVAERSARMEHSRVLNMSQQSAYDGMASCMH